MTSTAHGGHKPAPIKLVSCKCARVANVQSQWRLSVWQTSPSGRIVRSALLFSTPTLLRTHPNVACSLRSFSQILGPGLAHNSYSGALSTTHWKRILPPRRFGTHVSNSTHHHYGAFRVLLAKGSWNRLLTQKARVCSLQDCSADGLRIQLRTLHG